jgi:hypothetical protein
MWITHKSFVEDGHMTKPSDDNRPGGNPPKTNEDTGEEPQHDGHPLGNQRRFATAING